MYSIHHRRILWSSYRKLAWVGFQPTTTEFTNHDHIYIYIYIYIYTHTHGLSKTCFLQNRSAHAPLLPFDLCEEDIFSNDTVEKKVVLEKAD